MAMYYLMSQLPSLDGISESMAVPITEERFMELCDSFLDKKTQRKVEKLTLAPIREFEKTSSSFINKWNDGERNLRLALGKARADKMKKTFDIGEQRLPVELVRVASTAVDIEDPLEAERFLDKYRLEFLETLRPMDMFSEDSVLYYGLKLKLILRARQFDAELGKTAYRNIYTSIVSGDRLEDIQ